MCLLSNLNEKSVLTSDMALFRTQMISPIFFASSELTPFSDFLQWFLQLQLPITIIHNPERKSDRRS